MKLDEIQEIENEVIRQLRNRVKSGDIESYKILLEHLRDAADQINIHEIRVAYLAFLKTKR